MSAGVMTVERLTEDGLHFLEEPSGEYERIEGLLNMTFIKMRAMSKEQGIWYDSRGRKGSLIRSDKQMIQKQAEKKDWFTCQVQKISPAPNMKRNKKYLYYNK